LADTDQGVIAQALASIRTEWAEFGVVRQQVGGAAAVLIAVLLAAGWIWWKWDDLAKRPGVSAVLARLGRRRIVPVPPGTLTVALVHLDGDQNREYEGLLRDALDNEFDGAVTKPIDRVIALPDADTGQAAVAQATDKARDLLRRSGADVLLWGKVVRLAGKSAMRLYWTTANDAADLKRSESYAPDTTSLPPLFWDDLKQVLGMLAQSRIAQFTQARTGHYTADKLAPLIEQVRRLLQARRGSWTAETEAGVRFALAGALLDFGGQGAATLHCAKALASTNRF